MMTQRPPQPAPEIAPPRATADQAARRTRLALILILAFALGLRLLLWSQPLHEPANDEVEYITVARDLLAGRGWSFYERYHWLRAPLYPLFLAASWRLAGDDGWPGATQALHLAALPNIALSVASVYLTFALTRRLIDDRAALIAAALNAILWTHATFASLYMAETLFAVLFQLGMLCLLKATSGQPAAPRWGYISAAAVSFGLATLTRSIAMLFLPVAAVWLVTVVYRQSAGARRRLALAGAAGGLLLGGAALTIAPWTIRNYQAYGGLIIVETGLAYNLWVFNEPREDRETIHRELEQISNPVERADYASARGMERLREDPWIIARKLWPNWVFLARIKPIQDRFLMESYYADVELPVFVAALVFDDLLYLAIGLGAIAGLIHALRTSRAPPRAPTLLSLLWLGYAVATMLATHGEARYRHFLFPLLLPYAAWIIATLARQPRTIARGTWLLSAPLAAVFLWTVLTAYPWDWAGANLARGGRILIGDIWMARGAPDRAAEAYLAALEADKTADGWLRLGAARLARDDSDGARDAYRAAWDYRPLYYIASARLGDLERNRGDRAEARRAFAGYYVDAQRVTDWTWRMLGANPPTSVNVGDGLDFGYVGGVYPAEEQQGIRLRWSAGRALLRLANPNEGAAAVVTLRLAAPHPGRASVPASVCSSGVCHELMLEHGWRDYRVSFTASGATPLLVEIRSPTFDALDGRRLGVMIDMARVR